MALGMSSLRNMSYHARCSFAAFTYCIRRFLHFLTVLAALLTASQQRAVFDTSSRKLR